MEETKAPSLHETVKAGSPKSILSLISQGTEINAKDKDGNTPLCLSILHKKHTITEILLRSGADCNIENSKNLTPLQIAISSKDKCLIPVRILLKSGADMHTRGASGRSALHLAANLADISLMTYLLDRGVEVDIKDEDGYTPLHLIAYNWRRRAVTGAEILLARGACVNAQVTGRIGKGDTPLHIAASLGHLGLVNLLLENKADVKLRNSMKENPLSSAIDELSSESEHRFEVVRTLVDHGADVNNIDYSYQTPLIRAVVEQKPNYDTIKCLLENGANVNHRDRYGTSALIYFSRDFQPCEKSLQLLLDYGADVNVVNDGKQHVLFTFFSYLEDPYHPDFFGCSVTKIDKCCRIILQHVAILQAVELPVNKILLRAVSKKVKYSGYLSKCTEELKILKSTKIPGCWITFFNLLTDNKKKLIKYAGNRDVIREFEENDFEKKFPIYGARIFNIMTAAVAGRALYDQAAQELSDCLPIFKPDHLVIRDILDCVSVKDFLKVCDKQ